MPDLPKGLRIPISLEEWKAFTSWLIQNKQPLPTQSFTGQIDISDPLYQSWVSTGKVGFTPPPAPSIAPFTKWQEEQLPQIRQWTPPNQGGAVATQPTSPSDKPISTSDQAMLDQVQADKEYRQWQMGAPQREENAATIADARLRYREYADWQNKSALNEQNIQANAQQFAWDTAQQRFANPLNGLTTQNAELQRQVNEMQFEKDRQALLSGTPSNDWVTRHVLENMPNRYAKQEVSPIDQLDTAINRDTAQIQSTHAELVNASNAADAGQPYPRDVPSLMKQLSTLEEARQAKYDVWKKVQDESVNWSPQGVPQPYPNAPNWLPQYAPGLQQGKMITRVNVPTPSGQQFNAMSPTQTEQLGYYAKWAGQNWNDTLNNIKTMQPLTPGGAGRFGWQPSRQV